MQNLIGVQETLVLNEFALGIVFLEASLRLFRAHGNQLAEL